MSDYPHVHDGGDARYLALDPRKFDVAAAAPLYGQADPALVIPREQWQPTNNRHLVWWRPLDQDGTNFCHSFAGTGGLMFVRELMGLARVELSAGCLASQVTGGRNRGASLDEVLPVLMDSGMVPASVIAQLDYNQARWPADWKTTAAAFTMVEAYDCGHENVFERGSSALQAGCGLVFGMDWGGGGHALLAYDLFKDGNGWGWRGVGSWGPTAHDGDGHWAFSERKLPGLAKYGCFAVRVANRPAAEPDPPPLHV